MSKTSEMPGSKLPKVTIYTDGGCVGNPGGIGGWAAVLLSGYNAKHISGGETDTTNNRMELTAAIQALKALKRRCQVELFTDSQYLRKGISEWLPSWIRRGWKTTQGDPVKNQDLWETLHAETIKHEVAWKWCKGHANNGWNNRCDELAGAEIKKLKGRKTSALCSERVEETNQVAKPL